MSQSLEELDDNDIEEEINDEEHDSAKFVYNAVQQMTSMIKQREEG